MAIKEDKRVEDWVTTHLDDATLEYVGEKLTVIGGTGGGGNSYFPGGW